MSKGSELTLFQLGAFFGAIGAFVLGDKLGRRRTIALGVICNVVGSILQALSWHLPQMIVGRLVNGFGIGLVSSMSPVYLSECAPSHVRGMLLAVGSCCNVACFCVANWIAFGLYHDDSAFQWRFPLAFQLIFLIIVAPILFFVPESPRWLLLVDRDEEALHVLSRLAGHSKNIGDSTVTAEFQSIKAAIQMERDDRVPLIDVLCHRDKSQNFRRLILGCGTQFMQQFRQVNCRKAAGIRFDLLSNLYLQRYQRIRLVKFPILLHRYQFAAHKLIKHPRFLPANPPAGGCWIQSTNEPTHHSN